MKLKFFLLWSNITCNLHSITLKKRTITLSLNGVSYIYNQKSFNTENDTFREVLKDMDLENFVDEKGNVFKKGSYVTWKIKSTTNYNRDYTLDSNIDDKDNYIIYFTDNYIDPKITVKICNETSNPKFRIFLDEFKKIDNEFALLYYFEKNKILNITGSIDNYYIEKFSIGLKTIIDDKTIFDNSKLLSISKEDSGNKLYICVNKYKKYQLTSIGLTTDLLKIYKLKNINNIIKDINKSISKVKKKLNFQDINNIITNDLKYDGIVLNYKPKDELPEGSFNITIKEDPKCHFLEHRKCKIKFVSDNFMLEDSYKEAEEIEFNNEINEEIEVQNYIFTKYGLSNETCKIKKDDKELYYSNHFQDNSEYVIKILKEVKNITKKKESDDLIFNILLKVEDPTNYELKNITDIPQFTLKKGSTNNDLTKYLKDNYELEVDWIHSITDNAKNFLSAGEQLLKGGDYVLTFKNSENKFVQKIVKKPITKDITLTIVPKNENNYKLKGISDKIIINVIENITFNDLFNEIKKIIADDKFEIYVDNNKVENGNIDINKVIVIKLLDDCGKLEEEIKDEGKEEIKDDEGEETKNKEKEKINNEEDKTNNEEEKTDDEENNKEKEKINNDEKEGTDNEKNNNNETSKSKSKKEYKCCNRG